MAPPRLITREQCELFLNCLEENKDMSHSQIATAPAKQEMTKQKWITLAKKLNAVPGGTSKTPDGWKRYWFEWRHKCRKKATDVRRYKPSPEGKPSRFVPLNDLEVRVLELCGAEGRPRTNYFLSTTKQENENEFADDDSDSEHQPLETVEVNTGPTIKFKKSAIDTPRTSTEEDGNAGTTPPPQWALDLEQRRIAAEERMAEALESMAATMRMQEERRGILEERMTDALTALAGTVQDLNSGIQEALQHFKKSQSGESNREQLKDSIFL